METIDALGLKCPTPLIQTKRKLDGMQEGTVCTLVDDDLALPNLMDYAKSQGFEARYEEHGNHWAVFTTKKPGSAATQAGAGFVMVLTGTGLGRGNTALGAALLQQLLEGLPALPAPPDVLVFMNAGIQLNVEGSPVAETLLALEDRGLEIITCGACLDYYGMKDALLCGKVGNMYVIVDKMAHCARLWHVTGESE